MLNVDNDYYPLDKERELIRLYGAIFNFIRTRKLEMECLRYHHKKSKQEFIKIRKAITKAEKDLRLLQSFFKDSGIQIKKVSNPYGEVIVDYSCRELDFQEVFSYKFNSDPSINMAIRYMDKRRVKNIDIFKKD